MNKEIELIILDFIKEHYGNSEANDPCYDIEELAKTLENKLNDLNNKKRSDD